MAATADNQPQTRQRVPASERRDALIDAAIHEFAHGGLHGTPVDKVARRVGVAQPYVFSLFGSKRELFIAAVERCFGMTIEMFERVAAGYDPATAPEDQPDVLMAMAAAYVDRLQTDRDLLMLQLHAYAACDDEVIREHVRDAYARLVNSVAGMSDADAERIDEFFRYGMSLNVAAAMGVLDLSCGAEWVREEATAQAEPDAT
ncbi:MAG TPA: TetR/AcrR family transcriptional regulator [Solirubrobacteraceae bacterium]|nr:TetR/AcrR family transcriptional regulator [Solirubrobacteraceae bacterium]